MLTFEEQLHMPKGALTVNGLTGKHDKNIVRNVKSIRVYLALRVKKSPSDYPHLYPSLKKLKKENSPQHI